MRPYEPEQLPSQLPGTPFTASEGYLDEYATMTGIYFRYRQHRNINLTNGCGKSEAPFGGCRLRADGGALANYSAHTHPRCKIQRKLIEWMSFLQAKVRSSAEGKLRGGYAGEEDFA